MAKNDRAQGNFLGALTSELDESSTSHPVAGAVERAVADLLGRRRRGELDDAEVLSRISALTLSTPEGFSFAVGASTSQWYVRRPGDSTWRLVARPTANVPVSLVPGGYEWAIRR